MGLEFDYIDDEPIVPISLTFKNKIVNASFFVDSGADITMIPLSMAKTMGFKKWKDEEIETAKGAGGGSIPYFERTVLIKIGDVGFKTKVACSLQDNIPLLMGRRGFLRDLQSVLMKRRKRSNSYDSHVQKSKEFPLFSPQEPF